MKVVLDGRAQADAWLASPAPGCELLATSADAQHALERAGVSYRVPEEFYSAEECRPLKDEVLSRVYRLSERLDGLAREREWPGLPESFRPFWAFVFQLRHVLDQARFTEWRLRRFAAAPAWFGTAEERLGDDLGFRRESAWSRAAESLGGRRLGFAAEPEDRPAAREALKTARGFGRRVQASLASRRGGLVLLSPIYSLGALAEEASRHGVEPRFLDAGCFEPVLGTRSLERLWESFAGGAEERDLLDGGAVERRLRHAVVDLAPRAEAVFLRSVSWLRRNRPLAAVGATMNWREKIFAQACRAEGVPFIVYAHGNIGTRQSEIIWYNDMASCDLYLVGGEAQRAYCLSAFPQARCRVEAVGSAALDRLAPAARTAPANARPLAVYALGGLRDFRYPQYHRMASSAYLLQKRVVDLFGRRPSADLVLKLYGRDARESPIAAYVADRRYPNVRAVEEPPFSQWLPKADAFIIDFPSTTLSEMALTDRPIFFLDALADLDWLPEARRAIERRCVFIKTLEELETELGGRLDSGRLEPNRDRAYLEGYGVARADGRSAERAWAAVSGLIAKAP